MGKRVDDARRILLDGASGVSSNTNQNAQPATRVSEANSILKKYTPSGFEQMDDDGYKYHKLDLYKPAERSAGEYQVDIDRLTVDRKKLRKDYNIAMTDISAKQRSGNASVEEINAARDNANAIKTKIDDLDKQLEELKTGKWRAENSAKYGNITSNADFAEKSKIIDNSKGSSFGMTIGGEYFGFGDDTYAYINDINNRRERGQQMREGNMDPDAGLTKYSFMSQNEKDIYNYLYQTEGKKSAKEYLDYIEYDLDYRRSQQYVKDTSEYAEKHPILSSAQSVPQNLISGIGLLDVAGQNAARGITGEYKPINYYGNAMNPTNFTTAVRGTVSQDLADEYGTINISEEDHPFWARVLNGKSLGDVYQLGMSMVDSGATAIIGSATGVGAFGTVMLGGSAGSQGVLTALEKGASDDQALAMGILNGTFEALFEHVSMDKLLNGNTKGIIKTVLKQGFVEGTEELSTTLSNTIADICVMAENSDYRRSIQSYMDQGYSQKEAEVRAMQDIAIGMGWDFIGGAISGGIMGGGKAAIDNYILEPYSYKKTYGQDINALVSESLEISPDNKLAREIQSKLDDKKKVSGRQIRDLVNQNEADILSQDKASITSAIEQRLTEYGETGYIPSITKAIAKQVFGEKLNSDEMRLIRNSKYGQRVANELNPENIRSGGYNTQWSEQLDTNRINPEEYSRLIQDAENEPENASETTFNYKTSHNTTAAENAPQKQEYGVSGTVAKKESVQETENTENEMTIEDASQKYGAQAGAFIHTYQDGQDVEKFDAAYQYAYEYGKSGVPMDTVKELDSISYLTEQQRELAYEAGKASSDSEAKAKHEKVTGKANGKTGRRKGTVKGEGVTISDIKSKFNDQQGRAYRVLSTIAESTGIDIVLYQSEPNAEGKFTAAQGAFKHKTPDKIYVDLNSGLMKATDVNDLAKYAMLRTFSHEFVHYVEYWNPVQYNEFRKVVFDELTKRGENVNDLIEEKITTTGLSYEAASREVVAEAMTDILPDSKFAQNLIENHKSIFNKLLEKLKEFVSDLRAYFNTIGTNRSREANALKEQIGDTVKYVESIVDMFDTVSQNAVDNFQKAYAVDEISSETETTTVEETKVETEAKTNVETKAETKFEAASEPKTTTSEYGFTISDNVEYGSIEISFDSKPSEAVRNVLKENKFRWNGKKKVWYGKTSRETITDALNKVYEAEKQNNAAAESAIKEPVEIEEKPIVNDASEVSGNNKERTESSANDPYNRLAGILGLNSSFTENGMKFSIGYYSGDNIYYGQIERESENDTGLYPISNARDMIYRSVNFNNRSDAVDDIVSVARTNHFLDVLESRKNMGKAKSDIETSRTPSEKLAEKLISGYINEENIDRIGKALTSKELYALADEAFGGTQAEGAYNRKDAYDALELAVNKFLIEYVGKRNKTFNGTANSAVAAVEFMEDLLNLLPTQSVRTQEQQDFQQFSTPPNIAYLAAWAANITNKDSVLEPSAGIGGLALFAKAWGAEVTVNELSNRRLEVLRSMGFDHMFNENAEQIDNILPENISPSVVIMNPPFSATAGRTSSNKTSNAEKHINQALARLRDGGRLVAILGKGMNNNDYAKYWNKLRAEYNIRANISIDGSNYKKYGTTWGVQIVVIDKTGAQTGDTVTGSFTDLTEVPKVLEGIRNDRSSLEENRPAGSEYGIRESVADGGNRQSDAGNVGSSERPSGSSTDNERSKNRESTQRNEGAGNRANRKTDAKTGSEKTGGKYGRTDGTSGRADSGNGNGTTQSSELDRYQPEPTLSQLSDKEEVGDDGVYATFISPDIPLKGGKRHPAVLVESAAMAAVPMPKATYKPNLPDNVVKNNLSDAQLVTVTYAGQSHEQMLPDGRRKGFFIGDGTGVGKGRQIAGIILDNFMQGRKKAVWISKNNDLYGDAIRDWTATTGRSKDEVFNHSKIKPKEKISIQEGILYSTYDTLKSEKGGSRLDQIVDWLGEDFDGVIAFDEAHNMGNLFGKKGKFGKSKGSEKAKAGVELQKRLPNARIVYVSATAATEVDNLAYADRIGLWGKGTAFADSKDFISKIGSSGLAAMELVVRDMKAMGVYVARSISYNGVNYDTIEHNLSPMQTEIYNTMSKAWQKTMSGVQSALESTGGKNNSTARQRALGNYYSAMQRFYNQVLTSMSMPSVIADIRRELDEGNSCVLQVVNTNEAQQNKQLAAAKAEGSSLDDLDLTPREALVGYLTNSFPIQMFEEYVDDDGNLRTRPVTDSAGNPVYDKSAIRQRDAMIDEVNQMSIPDGPLEMLFDAFGTDAVAENTGRSRRVVPKKMPDGSIKRVEERRTLNHRTADVQAFQDGKKRILIFSDAGGTGKSYHASLSDKNQQHRVHYVLQPGWVASNAVQGFGRTHRSNEASAPDYKLVTTNIKGQKRFTSTIARRLDQLGALTKGQRDTGSGMFGAKDNLETDLAKDSLREFYIRLGKNKIDGIDGMETLDRLGLKQKFTDEHGAFKVNDAMARDISTFLNRILALEVDEQNAVFDEFISIYEMELEAAIQSGTLDTGMENVKADKIEILDDKVIRQDENTGASTHYIQAKTYTRPKVIRTVDEMSKHRSGFVGIYKTENGSVKAVFRIADKTTEWGDVQKQYRIIGPNLGAKTAVRNERTLEAKMVPIDKADWQKEWDAEVAKVPEYNEDTIHMLSGALLPIWNNLPQEGNTKVKRLIANDGSTYLGRVIEKDMIDNVLRGFSVGRTKEVFTPQQVMDKAIKEGVRFQLTNNRAEIFRSRVSGEWRLEIRQQNQWYLAKSYPGIIHERIQYVDRYFIPVGENGLSILEDIIKDNPVRNTSNDDEQYQQRTSPLTDREVLSMAAREISVDGLNDFEFDALRIFRQRLENLNALEEKRREEGRLYKEQQFGANVDRAEAEKTLNRMKILDRQIARASNEVLDVEKKEVLKRVLQKSRKIIEKNEREHGKELLNRYRDRQRNAATIKKYKERIKADTDSLTKWILHPKNKDAYHRVPDALKNTIIPFLTSIDFTSKRQLNGGAATKADEEFMKQMKNLRDSIRQNMDINGIYSGYSDLPPGFMDDLQRFIDSAEAITKNNQGQFVINRMTSNELKTLSKIVRVVKSLIVQMNSFHQNAMFQHTYDAGDNSIRYMGKMDNAKNTGAVSDFLLWQQIRPAYAFERFGDGGIAIYDEFRRAQATLAFNTKKIIEFTEETYTKEEINAWEKEEKTFVLGGDTVTVPVSYLMGLYELSKRPQALGHLLGAGMRVATYKNGRKKIADVGHKLTPGDISKMINELTPRQKEVADKLQQFMAKQGAEWGNYVSVARFGEEMFGEEHYYPINSDGRHLQSTADEHPNAASLYALLNMSFTKELQEGANNRIILYSIFDVFANHMASMAQYNAFALPILDSLKWFNYQQIEKHEDGSKTVLGSVREQMARVYGTPEETRPGKGRSGYAETFVMNIIKAFNGTETQGIPTDETGMKLLHRYNMAQVAYNFSVVVQQPMAITRAGLLIDYSSIIKGLKLSPKEIKANIKEMQKHSGIAAWKDLGFYDINISRGLTEMIKHNETKLDKVNEIGMWGAEKADLITWAAIWSACKEQIIKGKNIPVGSDDFYDAVTKLFEDVIYKTQVVDSVLTKNEFLRSKGVWSRMIGSFMSEPTTTASMLIDAFEKYVRDMKTGMNRQQAWKKNGKYIVRVAYVYAIGSLLLSVVTGVEDALRDDDDYQTFLEKWLEAFGGNLADELNPMNKLPIMRDFYELVKSVLGAWGFDTYGNEPRSVIFQWRDYLVKSSEIFHDLITGTETNYGWYGGVYKLLQAASGITGLPMGSAMREFTIAWNYTVGAMAPSLKARIYDPGTKNSIKYAYQDGYLTEEEAISKLIESGEAEDENDAYWIVNGFDGDGKYDALKYAIEADDMDSFDDAMDELTTHGADEKTAISNAKSTIKELYTGSEAVRMLAKYTGMTSDDIRAFYDSGVIRYSEAVSYLKKYAGKSEDDATATVERWKFIGGSDKYKDITTAAVSNYNEYCASAGISKDMYFNAWSTIKDFTGEDLDGDGKSDPYTKADKILSYIGSLGISRDQKTSLALAFGIGRTTIAKRAPW